MSPDRSGLDAEQARSEWLEADGLGGYAMGTAGLLRKRRYHALLTCATRPPTGRVVLLNGFDAWAETSAGTTALSAQCYAPDVVHPDGAAHVVAFEAAPWPRWTFRLADGSLLTEELVRPHETSAVIVLFRRQGGQGPARLRLRPFLSGREDHSLHHENPAFRFSVEQTSGGVCIRPYPGLPGVLLLGGTYRHEPDWYRNFLYTEESARGLDHVEDLASPGWLELDLSAGSAALVAAAVDDRGGLLAGSLPGLGAKGGPLAAAEALLEREARRRARFVDSLDRAADAYLVRRGSGRSLIAGYPWFTDWGRDTFLSLRGLCLATGRLHDARAIVLEWSGAVSQGMLPNRFPDRGEEPEYNAVDASLWFVVAAGELVAALAGRGEQLAPSERTSLRAAVEAILLGYAAGTRYGIRLDDDGLLAAGVAGQQLTWMDARVDGREITPRIGKPVELQALWANALDVGARLSTANGRSFEALRERVLLRFPARFWNERDRCLFDVVDVEHRRGEVDPAFRPNQILAVGGLPRPLIDPAGAQARAIVDAVEARLLTPLGLRTLAPGAPGYAPRYRGGVAERDGAYHQGTVWPWLLGPFVEAWVRVRGGGPSARSEARARFVEPLVAALPAWNGHLPEVADAEPPHSTGGCPMQAWSLGELIRLDRWLSP